MLREAIQPYLRQTAERYLSVLSDRGIEGRIVEDGDNLSVVVDDPAAVARQFDESWAEHAAIDIGGRIR